MKVWVVEWDNRPTEARTEGSRQRIIDEAIADGVPYPDGFEFDGDTILVDDWMTARLVEVTD